MAAGAPGEGHRTANAPPAEAAPWRRWTQAPVDTQPEHAATAGQAAAGGQPAAAAGQADLSLPGEAGEAGSGAAALKRARVYVTGHVQGVHFRVSTRRKAEELNVRGWVRNLPDGRVEAVFEGTPFAVDELVAWCRRGPEGARVRHVEVGPAEGGHEGPFEAFEVLRTPR